MRAEDVMRDPSASDWLKEALRAAMDRDCVDAAHDSRVLAGILEARMDRVLQESAARPCGG